MARPAAILPAAGRARGARPLIADAPRGGAPAGAPQPARRMRAPERTGSRQSEMGA